MMFGGGLMMGIGLIFLLLVIAIPILLVFVLLGGTAGFLQKQNRASDVVQSPLYATSSPIVQSNQAGATSTRYCQHCGAGLQAAWTHCPQCGAPIS
jgi:predicted lipid-binding transport protein (Tim44 family)